MACGLGATRQDPVSKPLPIDVWIVEVLLKCGKGWQKVLVFLYSHVVVFSGGWFNLSKCHDLRVYAASHSC